MPKPAATIVEIPGINVQQLEIVIVGDSSLIMHKWSEKAKGQMRDKQMKKANTAKQAKDPEAEFKASLHNMPENGSYGFPCGGFKRAAVSACRTVDGLNMTLARNAFHVNGDLALIEGDGPTMREDMVRLSRGVADIRYRGEFKNWRTTLSISYNADVLSPAQIVNLFNLAGFGVGIGEWRPATDGTHGRFHVATEKEV